MPIRQVAPAAGSASSAPAPGRRRRRGRGPCHSSSSHSDAWALPAWARSRCVTDQAESNTEP